MEEVAVRERADTGRGLAIQSSPGKPLAHLMEDFHSVASCPLCKLSPGVIESDVILVLLHLNGNCQSCGGERQTRGLSFT